MARVPAVTVTSDATVSDAVSLMVKNRVGAIVVVDGHQRVVGMFTERDNLNRITFRRRDPCFTRIKEVMTKGVDTVLADTEVEAALEQMIRRKYRHLPIVDPMGSLLGIVSLRYLLMRLLSRKEASLKVLEAYVAADAPD